jgi:transcriptional regulator with XRE-family HTH domain
MNLSRRIRELRYAKGWSKVELASRAKVSRSALSQLERGATAAPHAETLKRITQALGVPLEVLLEPVSAPSQEEPRLELPAAPVATRQLSRESPARMSSARIEELVRMFAILLTSPLAEALARIVEESSRLIPIIPYGDAGVEMQQEPHGDEPPPRRERTSKVP